MRRWICSLWVGLTACAGAPPSQEPPPPPLSVEEVERTLRRLSPQFGECYQFNRVAYGLAEPSSYVIRLIIDPGAGPSITEIKEATVEGQEKIEQCLVEALEGATFRPFSGEPYVVDVPIQAPKR